MTMDKVFKLMILMFALVMQISFAKVQLILDDEIDFRQKQGVVNGKITYGNYSFQGIGNYNVDSKNSVLFEIDRLMNNGKVYTLTNKPAITRQLKNANAKMAKGQALTLQGENQREFQEFSQIVANAP